MIDKPLVSVLMPVFNGQKYIRFAIESILGQTFTDFELLIFDDASSDETLNVIQSYRDERIRIKHFGKRQGLAMIRQAGVVLSKGKLIAFLDSDDYSLPDRLGFQVKYLAQHPDIAVLGSWTQIIDDNNRRLKEIWKHATLPENIKVFFLFRNCLTQSTVMMKKECFRKYGYRKEYWPAPDFDLWTRLSHSFKIANIPRVLSYYRISGKNMTEEHEKEIKECTRKIFSDNLKFLGIKADRQSIILHDSLERVTTGGQDNRLRVVETWLNKLVAANINSRKFNLKMFEGIIADYWFKTCLLNADAGMRTWRKYYQSPIRKNAFGNWKKDSYLFLSCLIHRQNLIDISSQAWFDLIYGQKMPALREY